MNQVTLDFQDPGSRGAMETFLNETFAACGDNSPIPDAFGVEAEPHFKFRAEVTVNGVRLSGVRQSGAERVFAEGALDNLDAATAIETPTVMIDVERSEVAIRDLIQTVAEAEQALRADLIVIANTRVGGGFRGKKLILPGAEAMTTPILAANLALYSSRGSESTGDAKSKATKYYAELRLSTSGRHFDGDETQKLHDATNRFAEALGLNLMRGVFYVDSRIASTHFSNILGPLYALQAQGRES